jgi:DNA-binding transcriptional LysR family regulator
MLFGYQAADAVTTPCRRIFSEIEAAEIELSQTHEAPRGTLRVSLPLIGILMMPNSSPSCEPIPR